jgi:hypothetical protein
MISALSQKLAKKEHGIVYPSGAVHISTIPLKLAGFNKKEAWDKLPKGWDASSRDKYAKSMSHENREGPVSTCMDKIKGHIDDPGAFCASLHDKVTGTTKWRGKKEAISATGQVAQLRDHKQKKKESKVSISEYQMFKKIREADQSADGKTHIYQVILIEEGLGNFKDCFFYTKQALQEAAQSALFDGAQSFADHPSEDEEETRPERSTRDILGYYENIQYQESAEGQGQLVANLCIADISSLDWANALLTNSLEYATKFKEKDLVGLSINASGSADPMNIDEFIQSNELSESVLAKLNEAKQKGISEIKVVGQLTDAQSVDLVTKAGAGGRVLKMLEQERSMGKFKENEGKSGMPHEPKAPKMPKVPKTPKAPGMGHHKQNEAGDGDGAPPAAHAQPGGDADGATPDHADAAQDQALFAKMIKQYLGKDGDQEEMQMAQHAYQAHREHGMEHDEAYEAAGKHLQMAMEIGKKMAQAHQAESEGESESETQESESEGEAQEAQTPPPNPHEGKKESMRVAKLAGEVAQMRESLKRYELRDYLDDKLKNSGESNAVTKKFREALGVAKSKEHIDSTWKVFVKAYKAGTEEVSESDGALFLEKNTRRENSEGAGIAFAGCLRED